jgi:trehalose 6-phosphate phosphatase
VSNLPPQLLEAAHAPVLLLASDFDGTLAPIVDDPAAAAPLPGVVESLTALSAIPRTYCALVSGRGLMDLRLRVRVGASPVRFVGSHGAEDQEGMGTAPTAAGRELLGRTIQALEEFSENVPGTRVERKPVSVALHYRKTDTAGEESSIAFIRGLAAAEPGLRHRHGIKVEELIVVDADKGAALKRMAHRLAATTIVFFGDDETDEDAFGVLGPADVGVRVGEGPTLASLRVAGPEQVVELMQAILRERRSRFVAPAPVPIQSHSVLSDQRTVAVVTPDARIAWLCLPRLDSGAIFADLVDTGGDGGGSFVIEETGGTKPVSQSYDGDSFVLITRWPSFTVTDYLDCSGGRAWQRAGRSDLVRVIEGTGEVRIAFAPRLDFGRMGTGLITHADGLEVEGLAEPLVLYSPGVQWSIRPHNGHQTAEAVVRLDGRPVMLELRCGTWSLRQGVVAEAERRAETRQFWSGWAKALRLPPLKVALVRRSALVVKALSHGPSGAIAAAATTSLPENLGGVRNWDYRFCWPRDAALAAAALVRLGNTGHALKLLDWLLAVVDRTESPERLRPIYTLSGNLLGSEGEISTLSGYAGSRPVRIGNAAAHQVQLDVFAPIVDLVALLVERGAPISPDHWRLVRAMMMAVQARWSEPDHGIWEIRGPKRHHVHSRIMCWHAINRGLAVEEMVTGRRSPQFELLQREIAEDVLRNGWNAEVGAFTIAYDQPGLDAATLTVGLTGLVPPNDDRFIQTIERIGTALRAGDGIYRYRADDGLPGGEGTFLLCTAWYIEALAKVGRIGEARALFERYAAMAGPTGLLAEEWDPGLNIALGNFPQAYSHLGLINCAVVLAAAGERD